MASEKSEPRRAEPESLEEAREAWVSDIRGRLAAILEENEAGGLATADRVAQTAFDVDPDDDGTGGITPSEQILREQIMLQGIDATTATIVARTLMRLDMNQLLVHSRQASELLGISTVSLKRNRENRRWTPAADLRSRGRAESVVYWTAGLLHVLNWRRAHPRTGGPYGWFPEQVRPIPETSE